MKLAFMNNVTFLCAFVVTLVQSRKLSLRTKGQDVDQVDVGNGVSMLLLGRFPNSRKNEDATMLENAKMLYNALTRSVLREQEQVQPEHPDDVKNDEAILVEHELKESLAKKRSALHDKPTVQQHGRNDFLVFQSGVHDAFVTIIPNDIYYNVEKKCVNWLDDCNERGIRARLLHRVQSPYK